jgi:hypothetical protein
MMQQNKQDMFSQYLPGALDGNKEATQMAQQNATPEQAMQLKQALMQMEDRQLQQTKAQQDKFASRAQWASTPEKWAQVTQMSEAEGLQGASQIPFERRGAIIAEMLSVKEQLDQEWKRREFQLQERNVNSQIGARNAAGSGGSGVFNTAAQRAQLAQAYGIDPKSPAGQKFVLTGQLPAALSPTDKKAILEADQMVMASQQGLGMLNQAKTLNPKAAGGFGMGTLADIFAQIGDGPASVFLTLRELSRDDFDVKLVVIGLRRHLNTGVEIFVVIVLVSHHPLLRPVGSSTTAKTVSSLMRRNSWSASPYCSFSLPPDMDGMMLQSPSWQNGPVGNRRWSA